MITEKGHKEWKQEIADLEFKVEDLKLQYRRACDHPDVKEIGYYYANGYRQCVDCNFKDESIYPSQSEESWYRSLRDKRGRRVMIGGFGY